MFRIFFVSIQFKHETNFKEIYTIVTDYSSKNLK